MKKDLKILEVENKVTSAEPPVVYSKFKTSDGWMACFDPETCEGVKKLVGKVASLEVEEKGKYKNITNCYGVVLGQAMGKTPIVEYEDHTIKAQVKPWCEKDPVGLAVDVFNGLPMDLGGMLKDKMEVAIALVKQAQEAFK